MELESRIIELQESISDLYRSRPLCCYDCGRRYEKGPDLVVSNDDWKRIAPREDGGGVLCPNCMNDRFEAIGASRVPARFMSGPFCVEGHAPSPVEPAQEEPAGGADEDAVHAKDCEKLEYERRRKDPYGGMWADAVRDRCTCALAERKRIRELEQSLERANAPRGMSADEVREYLLKASDLHTADQRRIRELERERADILKMSKAALRETNAALESVMVENAELRERAKFTWEQECSGTENERDAACEIYRLTNENAALEAAKEAAEARVRAWEPAIRAAFTLEDADLFDGTEPAKERAYGAALHAIPLELRPEGTGG